MSTCVDGHGLLQTGIGLKRACFSSSVMWAPRFS